MSEPVSTNLTITLSLNTAKPTMATDNSSSVSITYTATQKATANGSSTHQFSSNKPSTPTLKVYRSSGSTNTIINTITWKLEPPSGDWHVRNVPSTHIIGIVVSNSAGSTGNGGADFEAETSPQNYAQSLWASKNQIYNENQSGLTTAQIKQRNPFLLLSPSDTSSLKVKTSGFFTKKNSGGYEPKDNLTYNYRLYFYTVGLGVWWDDPSFDVTPTVGSGGDVPY